VGDSITCGYGVDGTYMVDVFKTETEDPMKAYAYLTAQKCGAQYQYVSWSGMGVRSAYVDENTEEPLDTWLFKDIYPYIDSNLEKKMGKESHSEHTKYDFSFKPHVIVFAEGTNDHSWTKGIAEREEDFARAYYDMLECIRKNNPNAEIIVAYGLTNQTYIKSMENTVVKLNEEGDAKFSFLKIQGLKSKFLALGHPLAAGYEASAADLIDLISSKTSLGWGETADTTEEETEEQTDPVATEPETSAVTTPVTTGAPEKKGCGSSVSAAAAILTASAAAFCAKRGKKRHNR
jgi:hypothetical protein